MTDFAALLQQGTTNAWLFIPSAILLGALHGLEPGHSKTMMAAFIIAIRGTVAQAVMLGLAATLSHTAVVWAVALLGLHFGAQWNSETTEPWLQLISAAMIIGIAVWMMLRTHRHLHGHEHEHDHDHDHDHDEVKIIDTGHGIFHLTIFEDGVPPRFLLAQEGEHGHDLTSASASVEIERPNGQRQTFAFIARDGYSESVEAIPEPHEFIARLHLGHGTHVHDFDVEFTEHGHHHTIPELGELELATQESQDPHELAHANDIRRRFANRKVTNGQILLFGLTGGLIPCPASITVLLLCLQLKQFTLGATLVLCFSIGLALTMVLSGVLAALSVKHVARNWSGFGDIAHKAPYFSGGLITLVGLYVGWQGLSALL
ncbi:MAG: nickel/cobalt efflux transporter RcnA [Nitrosomonadales bacterium]|nr:nickel/cobalt efflux transporter RcnA [Nitrosomonadales bacterium]